MNVYEQMIARWKSQSLARRPAVSLSALDRFEEENGWKVPADLRRVLLLSDGLAEWEYDKINHIRFWSLHELAFIEDCSPALAVAGSEDCLVFADYSLRACLYGVSLNSQEVLMVGGPRLFPVATSLEIFLSMYIQDSAALFRAGAG